MAASQTPSTQSSDNTATIVTALALLLAYPIGVIIMWFWPKWATWVKVLLTLPVLLLIVGVVATVMLVAINPSEQIKKAKEAETRLNASPTVTVSPSPVKSR